MSGPIIYGPEPPMPDNMTWIIMERPKKDKTGTSSTPLVGDCRKEESSVKNPLCSMLPSEQKETIDLFKTSSSRENTSNGKYGWKDQITLSCFEKSAPTGTDGKQKP